MEIRILHGQGRSAREIARRTGHSRNTVERYLRAQDAPRYTPRPAVAGKLSEHEAWLAERVRSALPERLSAVVLLREPRERGYAGGVTILRERLARLRPAPPPEPVVRFETEPGQSYPEPAVDTGSCSIQGGVRNADFRAATPGAARPPRPALPSAASRDPSSRSRRSGEVSAV